MALTKVNRGGLNTGISDSSDATAITIDSSEKVGIGQTTPVRRLHIKDTSADMYIGLEGGTSNNVGILMGDTDNHTLSRIRHDNSDNALEFHTNETERMRIDSSGNVGIGNNNPADFGATTDNLVIGTTSGENGMTIVSGTSNGGRIQFADNTSSPFRGAFEYDHSTDKMKFYTAGSNRMELGETGVLTVPQTSSNTTSASANMVVTSGGEFAKSTSSKRYKNTIKDATHGLTELLKLRSVTFKGNNDGDIVFGGLLAEEVHDAGLTEFVVYNDDDQPDALAYGNMVSLCIKAIQELSTKVTALETENKTQATQIADLISRVTALEKA